MELKKTENTIRGAVSGIINRFVGIVMPFILRTIMIKRLGVDYAGLNGLFSSILSVLSLSELGFGESIMYSMYEPIKNDDHAELGRLLGYIRTVYRKIGLFIMCAGLALMPFLPVLVKSEIPSDVNLYILYVLFLTDTLITYFWGGYRVILLHAHQRSDVFISIQSWVFLITYTLQIIFIIVFHNYYLYLLIMISQTVSYTFFSYLAARRMYPDIVPVKGLAEEEKAKIRNNVTGIAFHKVGDTVSTSLDSLVISAFLGLAAVTIYGNYNFVFIAVLSVMNTFFNVLTAGIGNKTLTADLEENRSVFHELNYVSMRLTTFCCACMMALYQPFMKAWVGQELMYPLYIAALFVLYFFTAASRKLINTYKNALGMWLEDKWKSIVACVFNLVFNIIMIQVIGIAGVVLSTILSYALIEIPWEVHVLYRNYFRSGESRYYRSVLKNLAETALVSAAAYLIINGMISAGMTNIIVLFAAGMLAVGLMLVVLHFREPEFKRIMERIVSTIHRMRRKEA
ncbi:MAG: hypothetical protein E7188_01505 [Erysipelotrichaceae bacterium]|nr:hypothetical protein [Erysipelotrichaceae bacterium]